jgi:alpha-1,6-mannosyltransferase
VRIVEICEFYSPTGGGVRNYVHQKLEAAARLGHDLTIIAPGSETRMEEKLGSRIAWVKCPSLPFDRNYRMFWRARDVWSVLDALSPDVVEASSPWRAGWIAANWPGAAAKCLFMHVDPVAVYPHTFLDRLFSRDRIDRMFGWFWSYLRGLSARFDATIVTGGWLARRFEGFGLNGIEVAPFGIDRETFSPERRDLELRRQLLAECGLGADASLLIAVGRHHPEKRLRTIIEAVSRAQETHPVGLVVVGDGFIRSSVERWAANARHIHVAGQEKDQARLASILASADALIHGSSAETFGIVVAEAICSGTPIIVPDAGGSADLAHTSFAEIYRTGDSASAAEAILRLLSRDREDLSRACIELSNARIGKAERHFENLFEFYAKLVLSRVGLASAPTTVLEQVGAAVAPLFAAEALVTESSVAAD